MRSSSRRAFTFIELLIIVAILALLLAFLLPALAMVRRAASSTKSQNNLRQLALAVHNYHDSFNTMPPIVGKVGNSQGTIHYHLLPFLEQDNIYKRSEGTVWKNGTNGIVLPLFLADEDQSAPADHKFKNWLALTNYAGSWPVFKTGQTRLVQIPDGTSNTLMFAQRYQMCGEMPTAWGYPTLYTWAPMFAYYSQGRFQHQPKQADCDPQLPQSLESAGIHVAMCDGSVRLISDRISPQTWWYATDPADGNVLGPDFNN